MVKCSPGRWLARPPASGSAATLLRSTRKAPDVIRPSRRAAAILVVLAFACASQSPADTIPPAMPLDFAGSYAAGFVTLTWTANLEPDLAGYHLYRGYEAAFVPWLGNLISTQDTTGFVDDIGTYSFYKLAAVDSSGNESPYASVAPLIVAVQEETATPAAPFALAPPAPTPSDAFSRLQFDLPRADAVHLVVYDVAGRTIRRLWTGTANAGRHDLVWDLTDDRRVRVANGVYFARLVSSTGVRTRRISVLR